MGKYKCINKKCKKYDEVVTANTHIIYKEHETRDKAAPCPECGEIREMANDGFARTTLAKGNPNIYRGE
ncbi:MAG TPA: hypothetical protein VJ962_03060 [Clostridia bacterium]|nr:hypothetical protein [Clostridia bacterium]